MEEKQLNEKESLELITRMISNTQQKLEKGMDYPSLSGATQPYFTWAALWYLFSTSGNPAWNYLGFLLFLQ